VVIRRAAGWATAGYRAMRRLELRILVALFLAAAGIAAFANIADEMREGDLNVFDETVERALRDPERGGVPRGPVWLSSASRDVTALGSMTVLSGVVVSSVLGLWFARRKRQALVVLAAAVSGLLVAGALKLLFDRARPDTPAALEHTYTSSFPSGHAFNSAVVYLTIGVLLAQFTKRWKLRVFVFAASVVLAALVAVSRVHLGYHHASDVVAGFAGGLAWAIVCALVAEVLARRYAPRPADGAPTLDPEAARPAAGDLR
jgi:undecaprenyl-diphosphatase